MKGSEQLNVDDYVADSTPAANLQRGRQGTARTPRSQPGVRRMAVHSDEAAAMLGASRDFFDEHVRPELRIVRGGQRLIWIPVAELERWLERSACRWPA